MRQQPKKNLTKVAKSSNVWGKAVRLQYQNKILDKAPIIPKPLEYDDIDKAVFEFVDEKIDIAIDGKLIPTFTLYSNQRFSEYSQTWQHTDENGNLYLNFKLLNRDKDPSFGGNQGELWNIPGNRRYTILQREVLDDNGTESYEVYSMRQPFAVDLSYTITFITTNVEYLNIFNQKINKLFSARQYYVRPNGHFVPMVIDEISDETSYSISDRKFFVQSVTIKLMAYIIEEDDFEVKKYPKRVNLNLDGDNFKKDKPCVEIEEIENPMTHPTISVNMSFKPWHTKLEFDFDTNMAVEKVITENVRNLRVMVNDTLYYTDKGFKLKNGDNVRIQLKAIDEEEGMFVQFIGYEIDKWYNSSVVPERVDETIVTHQEIDID